MDFTKMNEKPTTPNISGNWTKIWWVDRDWCESIPLRDTGDPHLISQNIVLKDGYSWIPLYATKDTTNKEDTGSELPDNDAASSVFKMKVPFDIFRREFVTKYGKKNMLLLVQKCGMAYPELMGDSCSSVTMSWKRSEGTKPSEENLVEFTFTREGAYPDAEYRGAINNQNVFTADDATPDVANGTIFMTSGDNSGALTITNLDNAVVGVSYTIMGGDGANATTISDGGNFSLDGAADWTGDIGSTITLYCRAASDFVELSRS
jgi:hypothetical protein